MSWQDEFDEKFSHLAQASDWFTNEAYGVIKKSGDEHMQDIKDFIADLLLRERKEMDEELLKSIGPRGVMRCVWCKQSPEYCECRENLKALLKG